MNARQLAKLGVPRDCVPSAITAAQRAAARKRKDAKVMIPKVLANPECYLEDNVYGEFAAALKDEQEFVRPNPISYRTWGSDIDQATHQQMKQACALPMAVGAALMPDGHVGYGLPIGGVLALDNAVSPFAVGVDIACRMRITAFNIEPDALKKVSRFQQALEACTNFGVGGSHDPRKNHPVMDEDWNFCRTTREVKDKAWSQLGTSGSGNHFAEFGALTVLQDFKGLKAGSQLVAFMTHSGSRGAGAQVCNSYASIAQSRMPSRYADLGRLAWLTMDSEAGIEYWKAMNLMGRYAAANHDIIHRDIAKWVWHEPVVSIENHHNFAWLEEYHGKQVVVHRKGATPAGPGVFGVIPGSMGTPAFVVRGLGNEASLFSASHGAGRRLSRRKARETYTWKAVQKDLEAKGITVLASGADEVPYAYKPIEEVMAAQTDLVEPVARFDPKIVLMSDDKQSED